MLYLTCSTRYSRPATSFSGSFGAVWDVIECSGKPHRSVELEKKNPTPLLLAHHAVHVAPRGSCEAINRFGILQD